MKYYLYTIASVSASILLSACGGGGGGSSSVTNSLGGVIAVGAPIANAQVTLVCGDGTTKSTTADSSGSYSFADLSGCSAPYVVKAVGDVHLDVEHVVGGLLKFAEEASGLLARGAGLA